jgi:hypothetical protein
MKNTSITTIRANYKLKIAYTALTVVIIWFALILQFSISIPAFERDGYSTGGAIVEFISFFTILTNLFIVKCLTILLVAPRSYWGRFFSKESVLTSIAVYITVVGLVYWLVLKSLWQPQGLFKLADYLLHTVSPILFIIYWAVFVPKNGLKWKNILLWLWFPFIYLIYILIRGAIYSLYPYPFMNVIKIGYSNVLISSFVLLLVFLGFGALYVWVGRIMSKNDQLTTIHT